MLDVGAQMPPRPGAMHMQVPVDPDIEQSRAVGRAVAADGRQPAAETALHQRFDARLVHDEVAAAYVVWSAHGATIVIVWTGRKVHSFPMEQTISEIAIDRRAITPLFRQVYAAVSASIVDGRLRAGTKLPASRALAERLGLSRTVVVAAYEQLLAEGYATGLVGSGTYVTHDLPDRPGGRARPAKARRTARYGAPRLAGNSTSPCRATTGRSISAAR